jgi:DNA helicase-2/ATP-dependent DNA helicase PcrA
MPDKKTILAGLNKEQRQAASDYHGYAAIISAPGSGKTMTLANRVAYMLSDGVAPENILLFTFTKKAAEEIRSRVAKYAGAAADGVVCGTYHSFCLRLLRRYCSYLGWRKNFSVYDAADSKQVLKTIASGGKYDVDALAAAISAFKEQMLSPAQAARAAQS